MIVLIRKVLISTMLSILGIATVGIILGASKIFISTVYQVLLVNIIIHTGLYLLYKIEIKYIFLEMALEYLLLNTLIISSGFVFNWYETVPFLAIIIIVLVVYIIVKIIDNENLNKKINDINSDIIKIRTSEGS